MKWYELRIHTTNEAIEPIGNILSERGASGLVVEDPADLVREHESKFGEVFELNPDDYPTEGVYIKTYLSETDASNERIEKIRLAIGDLMKFDIDIGNNELALREVHEEDWATAWKTYYKPIQVTDTLTIVPTWEQYEASSHEKIIELDPGMAFGTGSHATTKLCLQAIEKYIQEKDTVIDVGCGSGVLGIASVILGAEKVYAYDLDEVAVSSTKINAEINRVLDHIHIQQNSLLENVSVQANMIVSNILADIIIQFTDDAFQQLLPGGYFITSGIIQDKKSLVLERLKQSGFHVVEINELEDWVAIVAQKHS
ncbi:50S ribosomal protein L11 methyltransferase [Ornithinibacillus gellani]|uniref:50S ribosomal protein L11 methyltransferase n=1 Tax=Ornithinibacillus gellani TaxID=2293253 RepID=UPI000F47498B|nr:50S ribosomal protein L11 methyltransferase [Ornithinibacillus gellani]TQS74587.1 50S ribosomal protein L11 methyltransferase [Ornithinibacillus gellani]